MQTGDIGFCVDRQAKPCITPVKRESSSNAMTEARYKNHNVVERSSFDSNASPKPSTATTGVWCKNESAPKSRRGWTLAGGAIVKIERKYALFMTQNQRISGVGRTVAADEEHRRRPKARQN